MTELLKSTVFLELYTQVRIGSYEEKGLQKIKNTQRSPLVNKNKSAER